MTRQKAIEKLILISAVVSVAAVCLITIFIIMRGVPAISRTGLFSFLFSSRWAPGNGNYGVLALILGTLSVTLGALVLAIPTGICLSILISELLRGKSANIFKSGVQILAGIPSVVYGFFGVEIIIPIIRKFAVALNPNNQTTGFSVLAGAIVLAIMILPTIVSISSNSISSVPRSYKEASLALGADNRETITKVLLPAAKSGIISSIILAMGRAIGETMAVLLITGNVAQIPHGLTSPVATMTGVIAMEMNYATKQHQEALFAIGIVLFVIIVILNGFAQIIVKKLGGASK